MAERGMRFTYNVVKWKVCPGVRSIYPISLLTTLVWKSLFGSRRILGGAAAFTLATSPVHRVRDL